MKVVDFSFVSSTQKVDNKIKVVEKGREYDYLNGTVQEINLIRMPLRIVGGKVSNGVIPIMNFLLSPILLLFKLGKLPYLEHHGLVLVISRGDEIEYWTAQKYQAGTLGPIRAHKFPSLEKCIANVKDCGNNETATHVIERYEPKVKDLALMFDFMQHYDHTYSYIKPQHCQTFASAFLKRFC